MRIKPHVFDVNSDVVSDWRQTISNDSTFP